MVDLALNEAQQLLRQAARDFLTGEAPKAVVREIESDPAGVSERLWRQIAHLGWLALPLPESLGGSGGDLLDIAILAEELGRAAVPTPFLYTTLAALALAETGREDLLDRVRSMVGGHSIATWAFLGSDGRSALASPQLEAKANGKGYRLYGRASFVPYGDSASSIICPARLPNGQLIPISVDGSASELTKRSLQVTGGDHLADLDFPGVPVSADATLPNTVQGQPLLTWVWDRLAALKCAEMVGGIDQVLSMTTDYATMRVQFGRPIGSFQAVQHYCADMAILAKGARLITYQALSRLAKGQPAAREVSMAKVFTGSAYVKVVSSAAQIHGGLGYMKEYDLQFYFRSAKPGEMLLGTPDEHLERVATSLENSEFELGRCCS
ncbi:MAG: acyl-CoA/acyl-ACP dehydrogenase [Chloroflexi bacterium]|nr:acyl-CoA/acyl-ACP dehydrogenase [Chloroflexota bacterium]